MSCKISCFSPPEFKRGSEVSVLLRFRLCEFFLPPLEVPFPLIFSREALIYCCISLPLPNSSFIYPSPVSAPLALWVAVAVGAHPSCPGVGVAVGEHVSRTSCCLITVRRTWRRPSRTLVELMQFIRSNLFFLILLSFSEMHFLNSQFHQSRVDGNIHKLRPLNSNQLINI